MVKKNNSILILKMIFLFLAIINIILSFFISFYSIIISILCILICLFLRKKSKIFYFNIILYFICIVISIIFIIVSPHKKPNDYIGIWNCAYNDNNKFEIQIKINTENKFAWSKYQDEKNNYIIGTYKLKKIETINSNENIKYNKIVLSSDIYVENGKPTSKKFNQELDSAINIVDNQMKVTSKKIKLLKCNRISKENPIID